MKILGLTALQIEELRGVLREVYADLNATYWDECKSGIEDASTRGIVLDDIMARVCARLRDPSGMPLWLNEATPKIEDQNIL